MIEKSIVDHGIDRGRVFITGLSAGGAMVSNMLACYPEVFAGGAIIAGLPYGAATSVQQAFESMFHSPSRPAWELGDLVRKASSHTGPWPRVSVWHGNDDKTVVPSNALEILKQWTEVHGLPSSPSVKTRVDGYPREVWINGAGEEPTWRTARRWQSAKLRVRAALPGHFYCQWGFLHPTTLQSFSGLRLLGLQQREVLQ